MRINGKTKTKVIEWLSNGNVGMSSKFMAMTLIGVDCEYAHPHDPSDLKRCFDMLELIPELKPHIKKMNNMSPQWSELIKCWDWLELTIKAEWVTGRAPVTYKAMKNMGC